MTNLTERELALFTLFADEAPNSSFTDAVQSASDEGAAEFGALTANLVQKGLLTIEEDEDRGGTYFYLTDAGSELAESLGEQPEPESPIARKAAKRLTFKIDASKKLPEGCIHKTLTVDGKTFTLIALRQHYGKESREYTLKGPDVALHTDTGRLRYADDFTTWDGQEQRTRRAGLIRDEVQIGYGMAIHTAEAKAKKIIRKALA